MFVQLLPEAIGLIVTPLAIIGTFLLLQSAQPVPNAAAFGGGFALVYGIVAVAVLVGGAAAGAHGTEGASTLAAVLGIVIGSLFLLAAIVTWVRRPAERRDRAPRWATKLETAHPRGAFLTGLGLAILNPNIVILLSGLAIVVADSEGTGMRLAGAAVLVVAALLDIAVPIGVYVALGDRAERPMERAKTWLIAHTRVITIGMLAVLGIVFVVRGINRL